MTFNAYLFHVTKKYQFIGFASGFFYVCVIFTIQYWMKTRPKFDLKNFAVAWNASMLIINTAGAIGLWPTLVNVLIRENFYASICADRSCNYSIFCGFWLCIFPWIKIIELGDTVLLVLQKRKLAPYYWCHHLGALIVVWYIYPANPPSIISWAGGIIYLTHIITYLYSTIRSLGFSAPQHVPAAILMSEILHMMIGAILCLFIHYYTFVGDHCDITVLNGSIMFLAYLIFFFLSGILYYKRFYIRNKSKESKSVTTLDTIVA